MLIFPVLCQKLSFFNSVNSGLNGSNLTKVLHTAEKFMPSFEIRIAILQFISECQCDNED